MMGLDDEDALVLADHPPALAQDHLGEPQVASDLLGQRPGARGGGDLGEPYHSALGFGDDLLGDDEQVSAGERGALPSRCLVDEPRQVVARGDLRQPFDPDDLVSWRQDYRRLQRRAESPHSRRRAALRVPGPRSRSSARSSGASMSRPRPGRSRTTGESPRWRAASRWLSNDGSPNLSGMTSGGASRAALVPKPETEGTKSTPRSSPSAPSTVLTSSAVTQGTSPGMVRNCWLPTLRPPAGQRPRPRCGRGWRSR